MPDTNPVGEAAGTPEPVGTPEANANTDPQGAPVGETLTRADVEALVAKRTEHLTREIKKLGKAAPSAKPNDEATAPDPAALTAEAERRADLALDLMAAGMSKDMARKMSRADALLPTGWETSEEVIASLKADMPGAFAQPNTTRAPGGGGGRNTTGGGDEEYTPEYLDDMIGKHGPGWMTKERRAKIAAYEATHNTSGIRPLN